MAFNFQIPWGWMLGKRFRASAPISQTEGHYRDGGDPIPPGTIVRCTMVSGMGDVGVTTDLDAERGYNHRAVPFDLELLSDEEYSYEFDMDSDPSFRDPMFRLCYEGDITEWDPEVLNRSWWGLPPA